MKLLIKTFGLLIFLVVGKITFGQTNEQKAFEISHQGFKLEDEGKFEEAIKIFEEAQKIDPNRLGYPYEIGYCYFALKEYKKTIITLEKLTEHKSVEDVVYQLLGNSYDNMGNPDKAIEIYEAGLKKFPNSGSLYLEMGVMQKGKNDINKELSYYEKGIEVAPNFPSNYYWASKIFCNTTEEVWGMLYGEIFMNLERNTKRTNEISKLLFDTYKSEIHFTSDTSYSVSFSKNANIDINSLKDPKNFKLPFGMGCYEMVLMLAVLGDKQININSLDRIRTRFLERYVEGDNFKKYPNILFDYQQKVKTAGHFEAYNHWILMKGDEDGFDMWLTLNKEKWDKFVKWFTDNKMELDNTHKFYREQY